MNIVRPRLQQPLFHEKYGKAYADAGKIIDDKGNVRDDAVLLFTFIRAYDAIWNLLYYPKNMDTEDIFKNGEINLDALGQALERALGAKIFEPAKSDDGQLSFNFDGEVK